MKVKAALKKVWKVTSWILIILGALFQILIVESCVTSFIRFTKPTPEYADRNMETTIRWNLQDAPNIDKRFSNGEETVEDLEKLTRLDILYTGYYITLEDVEQCKNIRSFSVGWGAPATKVESYASWNWLAAWFAVDTMDAVIDDDERVYRDVPERSKQLQRELSDILTTCSSIERIYVDNRHGNLGFTDLDFLSEGKNLKVIIVRGEGDDDYSYLAQCDALTDLSLSGTDLTSADQLEGLDFLATLYIYDTPLEQDEEEYNRLLEMFPNTYIYTHNEMDHSMSRDASLTVLESMQEENYQEELEDRDNKAEWWR